MLHMMYDSCPEHVSRGCVDAQKCCAEAQTLTECVVPRHKNVMPGHNDNIV